MTILKWSNWYETGSASIDHQHQDLFDTLNRLHEATCSGRDELQVAEILDLFVERAMALFGEEEAEMLAAGFVGRLEHQAEHAWLLEQVADFLKATPSPAAGNRLTLFLADWLSHHTLNLDKQSVAALKSWRQARVIRSLSEPLLAQ